MANTNQLTVKRVPIGSIHQDPANVRLHDPRNLEAIKGSLARFAQQKPIVVDRAGTIRAGNGTYEAAKALGWTEIQVVETDLEGIEAVAYAIADNRTSDLSTFEDEALAKLLVELREQEALPGTGFDDGDLDQLLMELGQDPMGVAQDEVPLPPDEPVTKRGDLWILGRHRLLCGDSAAAEDVDRLLAGVPIHLVNSDPPYNVKVEPRSNNAIAAGLSSFTTTHHQGLDLARHPGKAKPTGQMRAKDRPLQNDFLPEEEFDRLLRAWFGNILAKVDQHVDVARRHEPLRLVANEPGRGWLGVRLDLDGAGSGARVVRHEQVRAHRVPRRGRDDEAARGELGRDQEYAVHAGPLCFARHGSRRRGR